MLRLLLYYIRRCCSEREVKCIANIKVRLGLFCIVPADSSNGFAVGSVY